MKTFFIPVLNIDITPLQEWTKPYNEIVIPKGYRLAHDWEVIYIARQEKYARLLFPNIGEQYYFVWCHQTPSDVTKGYARRLCLDGDLDLDSYGGVLAGSGGDGRVAFVRDVSKKKVKQ